MLPSTLFNQVMKYVVRKQTRPWLSESLTWHDDLTATRLKLQKNYCMLSKPSVGSQHISFMYFYQFRGIESEATVKFQVQNNANT